MKTKHFILSTVCALFSIVSFAQKAVTDSIKVYGECESCKKRIEKAALTAGASFANWSETSKILVVKFDAAKTSNKAIQQKVAAVGYDTKDLTATDAAYKNLPDCCQYQRKAVAKKS